MSWDLLGHEWAVELLQGQIMHDDVRHAYLFVGPAGIGRRTMALRFTQALNCSSPPKPGVPCRSCLFCKQIEKMQMADLFVVQAEKEGGTLRVDQIRELEYNLSLHPYAARYRVALVLRFEEAHPSAMNALLKTLEEPAQSVVLLLTADSPESLLPTVVSRCETIRLRQVSPNLLQTGLVQKLGLPEENATLLAHVSGGKPGLAIRLASSPQLLKGRHENLQEFVWLIESGIVDRFEYVEKHYQEREKLRIKLIDWLSFWRDVTLINSGSCTPITNLDFLEILHRIAQEVDMKTTKYILTAFDKTVDLIEKNINARLALEVLMLDLPQISSHQ